MFSLCLCGSVALWLILIKMKTKYKIIFIIILVILFVILYNVTKAQEKWRTITTKNGLSNRFIKTLKTDGKKVYIATANGLAIYDNSKKKIIKVLKIKDGLPDNYISAIAVEKEYIWIGTGKGLARYNKKSSKIITFTKKDGLVDNAVSSVLVDGDFLWVGTKFWGISRYDKVINKWQSFSIINGLVDNVINCMSIEGGYLWVGTKNGLSYYDKITGLWGGYDTTQGLQEGNIRSIVIAGQYLWLGTINGLIRFDKYEEIFKLYTTEDGLADDYIQNLNLDGIYLWIGTFSGVTRYNIIDDNWFTYTTKDGLIENSVSTIEVAGNYIWFGTDGNAISIFDKEIPQASISPLSYYSKPGQMIIMGTAYDTYNIDSYKIEYKNEAMKSFVSTGVVNLKTGNVIHDKLSKWEVKKLFNINYDVRLIVTDKKGNKNTALNSFTVDTKPPQMTLNLLPEAVKVSSVYLKGTYIDNNITKILININNKTKEKADLNRILKQYSKEIPLAKGLNNITITAYDIANLSSEINTKIVYDKEKPIITLDTFPEKSNDREVEINGKIFDSGIQRIVLNPGNEEIPFKKEKDNSFTFEHELKLEPGFNKFEISVYDFVGNKAVVSPVIEFVSSLPVVSIDKSRLRVSERDFTVMGSWSDDNINYILIEPFNERAKIDMQNRKFSLKTRLKKGENVITANIIDKNGNKYFDVVRVYYSTEKSALTLANLTDFTFHKKFSINGFYNEPNLKMLILNPGKIQISVDKANQKFSMDLNLKEGKNDFKLTMIDKYGAEFSKSFSIILDRSEPDIDLSKIPSTVYFQTLKIKGAFEDENIDKIYIMPGNLNLKINKKRKTFSGNTILNEGENKLQFIAVDKAGNKSEIKKTVTLLSSAAMGTTQGEITSEYVQQLKKEIIRLRALLQGGGRLIYKEREFSLPKKTGLALVPFSRLKGTSLFEISKKYLGQYVYIDFINKYNNISKIRKNKLLVLPTKKFIKNYVKINNKKIKDILDIVAISYKYSDRNSSVFKQKIAYFLFKKNFISKKGFNFLLRNGFIKGDDFLLSINKRKTSSLHYVINVHFSKSFVGIDIKTNKLYGKK